MQWERYVLTARPPLNQESASWFAPAAKMGLPPVEEITELEVALAGTSP